MTVSQLETILMPIAFLFLFLLMLLYWGQAAFFVKPKYTSLNALFYKLSIFSLILLISLRWVNSGHFPLSNLYESLLFLSWSFLMLKFVASNQHNFLQNLVETAEKTQREQKIGSEAKFSPSFLSSGFANVFTNQGLDQHSWRSGEPKQTAEVFSETFQSNKKKNLLSCNTTSGQIENNEFGLGIILSPMALLTFSFAFLSLPKDMQRATALVPALQSNWLMMHVTVMILSYAALLCGSVLAIAFLITKRVSRVGVPLVRQKFDYSINIQNSFDSALVESERTLNGKVSSAKDRKFVTSELLDNLSYRLLSLGFPLLTIGILSGAVWANEAWGSYWSWDPKETWALITWLVFAIYLHTRMTKGWSGEKSAIVAAVGFFVVWFCYLGVNLLGTGLHSYGWFTT